MELELKRSEQFYYSFMMGKGMKIRLTNEKKVTVLLILEKQKTFCLTA